MIVRVLSQLTNVFPVVSADVDIEEDRISIDILLAENILQVILRGYKSLGKAGLEVPRVHREVEGGDSRIAETVGEVRTKQTAIGRDIYPETAFGGIVDHLVDEIRPEQRLAAHESQHAAAVIMQPVDGAPRHVFGPPSDLIVV